MLLTPITGDVMAEFLTGGEPPEPARPFTPHRFASATASVRQEQPA